MSVNDLPSPDEPFLDAMQTKAYTPVPNYREQQQTITRIRKTLSELPLPAQQMNVISVVLTYALIGISVNEIAVALNVPLDQVVRLKQSDAYKRMHDDLVQTILDKDSDDVRTIIASHAKDAARTVAEKLLSGDENIQMAASRDILDRSGHRVADRLIVEGMDALTIRIVKSDDVPVIDITPKE